MPNSTLKIKDATQSIFYWAWKFNHTPMRHQILRFFFSKKELHDFALSSAGSSFTCHFMSLAAAACVGKNLVVLMQLLCYTMDPEQSFCLLRSSTELWFRIQSQDESHRGVPMYFLKCENFIETVIHFTLCATAPIQRGSNRTGWKWKGPWALPCIYLSFRFSQTIFVKLWLIYFELTKYRFPINGPSFSGNL